jgi:predicted RNase H-like HicB family nuclease
MNFTVTLEQGEDGYIVVECPSLPGCVSQGRTEEEAIELWIEVEAEKIAKESNKKTHKVMV